MVAIKEIKQDFGEDSKELQDFLNEAIVMMYVSHILSFVNFMENWRKF